MKRRRRPRFRWEIVDRLPRPGSNGVWGRTRTRLGAYWMLERILEFRLGGGHYSLPVGGLIIRRVGR